MSVAFWCVFVAGIMPVFFQAVAKVLILKQYDNAKPRVALAAAEGVAQRASWAHDNSWEAFAPFAAGVIIATMTGVESWLIDGLALCFIASRIAYFVAYVTDQATIRSTVWAVGFFSVAGLYFGGCWTNLG